MAFGWKDGRKTMRIYHKMALKWENDGKIWENDG
jgi:hypothetical protein